MLSQDELIRTEEYWMEHIQVDIFNLVQDYMDENDLNQTQLATKLNYSKGYISQVLNGNFNFSIRKLIRLCLSIGRVPILTFKIVDDYKNEKDLQWQNHRESQSINTVIRTLKIKESDTGNTTQYSYG